jgi:hypothetical protein
MRQRSIVSYLLLPRPGDWIKAVVAPGVYAVAAYAGGSFDRWPSFIALWLILEYLLYEARYQWNDLRGWGHDHGHVERRARARLPHGLDPDHDRRHILVSLLIAGVRVLGAVVLGWVLGVLPQTLILLALVYGIAFVYEWLRAVPRRATGRASAADLAIWIVVGLGYAVRAGLGLSLAGIPLQSLAGASGILCFAIFGVMFVLLTWVLEAAGLCRIDSVGWHQGPELAAKPHLVPLLRYAGVETLESLADSANSRSGRREKVLRERGRVRTPWNASLLLACGAAVPFGLALSGYASSHFSQRLASAHVPLYALAFGLGVSLATLLAVSSGTWTRVVTAAFGAVALYSASYAIEAWKPWIVVAPWIVIAVWYLSFRGSSYFDLNHAIDYVVVGTVRCGAWLLQWIMGKRTWQTAGFKGAMNAWVASRLDGEVIPQAPRQRQER